MTRRGGRIALHVAMRRHKVPHMAKPEPTIGVRMSPELLDAITARRARMAREKPGVGFTLSDVVRHALEIALAPELKKARAGGC